MGRFEKISYNNAVPVPTPPDELERILYAQRIEQEWWKDFPAMKSDADIERALAEGRAVPVPNEGAGYKISAKVPEQYRALTPQAFQLLQHISQEWIRRLRLKDIQTNELFLVISSLARTTEYQKQLQEQGYPAAENSTHTKLGAFDIAVQWFIDNRPELLENLNEVLAALRPEYDFNLIEETDVGAYHIGSHPKLPS